MTWQEALPQDDSAVKKLNDFIGANNVDTAERGWREGLTQPPLCEFDASKTYYWNIETNHGSIKVKLLPNEAPMHVSSTMYLAMIGFYDNLTFHRVIPDFMAQAGCPRGTGTGGPGYQFDGEYGDEKHDRPGLLSMANAGPGTDGSQFFLTFVATPWLDGKHSIFGEVVDGMETLKELEKRGSSPQGKTLEACNMVATNLTIE